MTRTPAPASLFVVGDPKQSIYRFRGADIFAYLGIRRRASQVLALDRNWRSVPGLVAAVNELFGAPLPFALPEIGYRPVAVAGAEEMPLRIAAEGACPPFALRLFPPGPLDQPWNKGDANRMTSAAAASEIAGLLDPGPENAGEGTESETAPDGEALRGSDIAVLVRTRRQGRLIAKALHEHGVRAAEVSDENVFDSREAEQLERLLRCLAEPVPETEVRGALAGDLFALDTADLIAMDEDDEVWSEWRQRLRAWRRCWKKRGIGALLLRLLEIEGGAERLLRHRDGTRRLTNYRHLAELLLEVETASRPSPSGLAAWLGRRRQAGSRDREESGLLRLDSDERLVRIVTVHGSKGLEFPVVFCPFAWDVPDPKRRGADPDVAYHERADEGYREVLDLAPNEAARGAARVEEFSESLRLLYVALTRAKRRCIVTWGKIKGAPRSPLAWLLHRGPQWRVAPECGESEDGSAGGTQRSPHGPADETTIAREHAEAATTTGGPAGMRAGGIEGPRRSRDEGVRRFTRARRCPRCRRATLRESRMERVEGRGPGLCGPLPRRGLVERARPRRDPARATGCAPAPGARGARTGPAASPNPADDEFLGPLGRRRTRHGRHRTRSGRSSRP